MARKRSKPAGPGLSIRVDLASGLQVGPGKVALLEAIGRTGSISAAGRALGMSYKRAWDLVEQLNCACAQPIVEASPGGKDGGGTRLTETGEALIRHYRGIEVAAGKAARDAVAALERIAPVPE